MANLLLPFYTGFASSGALIAAIGAQNLFVLRQGLQHRHVGAVVLCCAGADALLILLGVAGVGSILAAMPQLARWLTFGGTLFLSCYGVMALRRGATSATVPIGGAASATLGRAIATTAGFTFLNPHVYLDTVLLLGTIGAAQPAALRPIFVAGAASASLLWFGTLGFGARLLKPVFIKPGAWRVLDALVGATMLLLAGSLLLRAMSLAG